jgi:hypothetical protein
MRTIELPRETWRDVIAALWTKGLPLMREHADRLEQQLEHVPPDQATVTLYLADDVYWRSFDWVRWRLGILVPAD